ncbi:TonB-dependent receptor [Asticcacaulis sp. W401b]|uniref:TonB-dependent receptor n=1 Tax=Asticcacaulis sp. W401b TaxID=3388666 RepID=UPI003970BF1F
MTTQKALWLGAASFITLVAATQVSAQDASASAQVPVASDETEVVVVGTKRSLRTALQNKQKADKIVEVLASEDIGKLPDLSIAESLSRLPGLAANRDRGNASSINIRGMGAEFTNTLINGREQASAEASRNVRYESYPSELITGAYVYKSPSAAQAEGAIAGQVDMKTVRPLAIKDPQLNVAVKGEYSDLARNINDAKESGWLGSASYIDHFLDGKLGVAIGITGRDEPVTTKRADIYPYTNSFMDLNGDGSANDEVPFGFSALERQGSDKRFGALGTFQYRPNETFELVGDLFYSKLHYAEEQKGFEVDGMPYGNWLSGTGTVTNNGMTSTTGWTNWAHSSNYGLLPSNSNSSYEFEDKVWSGGLNAVWRGGDWSFTLDGGYSNADRVADYVHLRTVPSGDQWFFSPPGGPNNFGYTVFWKSEADTAPRLGFDRPLTDRFTNVLGSGTVETTYTNDEMATFSADYSKDVEFGIFNQLLVGARVTDRTKGSSEVNQTLFAFNSYNNFYGMPTAYDTSTPVPAQFILDPIHFDGDFAGYPDAMNIDIPGLVASYGGIQTQKGPTDWKVIEDTKSFYVQGNIGTNLFGYDLNGNIGVRVVRTKTQSLGELIVDNNGVITRTPQNFSKEFTDVLPNLNLTLILGPGNQIRFGASKAMARAPLDLLSVTERTYNYATYSAYAGNPDLDPYRATQVDLAWERYFTKDTALTVSLFYKDLKSFIVSEILDVSAIVNGVPVFGTREKPINGEGGVVKGVELAYQQAFSFLPAPFDGLGFFGNYSYTDSDVSVNEAANPISNIPLPGLSKNVGNAGIYYYKSGFEARIAYRYRDAYAGNIGGQNKITFNRSDALVDFFASYNFPEDTPLKGVAVTFQANNLTNDPFQTYSGYEDRSGRYELFGRRYWLGVSYKRVL